MKKALPGMLGSRDRVNTPKKPTMLTSPAPPIPPTKVFFEGSPSKNMVQSVSFAVLHGWSCLRDESKQRNVVLFNAEI